MTDDPASQGSVDKPTGIHRHVPWDAYRALPYISNSSLGLVTRSMAHYRHGLDAEREPTEAMRAGSFIHCGVLEPLAVPARYAVMPRFELEVRRPDGSEYEKPKLSKAYQEAVAEFEYANRDKEVVTQDLYDDLLGMAAVLVASERAREYLRGDTEVTIVWDDEETGLRCKARLDVLNEAAPRITDFKTTEYPPDFQWVIHRFAYHRQSAFYADGYETLTGRTPEFCIVAADKQRPYGVRSAPVGSATMAAGRAIYRDALRKIRACRESGEWPGYSDPDAWELPESKMPPVELTVGGKTIAV
jgi:hypothetical protein